MMRTAIRFGAVLAIAVLAGCGSSPKSTFYTLNPGASAPAAKTAYTVGIGLVSVPAAVDRPQFVLRATGNQVTIDEFARWAGPLKNEIAQAIAGNLTRDLDGALVVTHAQAANLVADFTVQIEVQRFESAPGEAAAVEVLWTVKPAKGATRSGRSVAREPAAAGYDALVAAHGRALAGVSRDIAAAIRALRG